MDNKLIPHHSHWGAFNAVVEGGRVIGALPFDFDPDPSPLIEAIPDAVHSPRVARPMVRAGWLENRPANGADRGREPFVPVEWEEALRLVAGELARVRREHGSAAIMGGSQGWSSAGHFHEARGQLRRFLAAFGGFVDQTSNYSFGTALTFLPHILGSAQVVTGPLTSWSSIARHTRLFVLFGGANPKNTQVAKGGCAWHGTSGAFAALARAGVHVVNLSPIREEGPEAASPEWLPIRPNTDTAMMLALTHTLVSERRHDEAFLARCCTGFSRVLPYLKGDVDGQPKDAPWAAAITDVPAETIRALARQMAAERTMLTASWSLQRADHGEQPYWALVLLAACLGQIGLPGGGFGFGYGSGAGLAEPPLLFTGPAMPALPNPAELAIPAARIADCLLHPGERYDFDGKSASYPNIRLVYWAGGNPFHHHQDLNRLLRAWRRPETIIVHEPWWTATARHADIVLPATTSLERNDLGGSPRDRFVIAMHKAIEPLGEARHDFDFFGILHGASAARRRLPKGGTRRPGCARFTARSASARKATSCRSSTRFGKGAGSKYRREPRNTCCLPSSAPTPRRTGCARPPGASSSIPARSPDSAMTIARRIPLGSSPRNGWAAVTRQPSRCTSSRASRATNCTARWMRGRSAREEKRRAARRWRSTPSTPKPAGSAMAKWCAFSTHVAPASPAS